jgi:branched-chain amino acid aminotransferase
LEAANMVVTFVAGDSVIRLGEWRDLKEASAALPPGSYTTLRTYGGRNLVRLQRHVERLRESVVPAVAPEDLPETRVRRAIAAALQATGYPESRLRVTFAPPRLFVSIEPFSPLPEALYREGVACATVNLHRENPHAKSTSFLEAAQQAAGTLPDGVHEGLMVDTDGAILEGLSSNFFAVCAGTLRAEDERALHGVTRSMVLELAAELVPRRGPALRVDELAAAAECFLTSVSREILPVVVIDGSAIGDGRPGPVTRELMRGFREVVAREAVAVR